MAHRSPRRVLVVKRAPLTFAERLYWPALWGGLRVTARHFFRKKVTLRYPEEKWVVPDGYRGVPALVKDQAGRIKCVACQLCEFVCPPKAICVTPPGPEPDPVVGNVEKRPRAFTIDMLRCIYCGLCQEACPEEAIFLMRDYSFTGHSRAELIFGLEQLLTLGGTHQDARQKWRYK